MSFEKSPQNYPNVIKFQVDERILTQKETDMRDFFVVLTRL